MQKKTFDRFMKNKFHYVVFSDARPELMDTLHGKQSDKLIQSTCDSLGVEHIAVPQEVHNGDMRVGTWKHMDCLDWAVRNYSDIRKYDYVWISDSDTFLMEEFDVEEYMAGYDFAGMPIFSGHVKYYRPQLIIYPIPIHDIFINYRMRTDYSIEGQHPDGCGALYLMFKEHPQLKVRQIMETYCKRNTNILTHLPINLTTHQEILSCQESMLKEGIHEFLYTDQPGFPTYTKEEHREYISNLHLPKHIEEYIDDIHTLSSNSTLSRNSCMNGQWDWRGNYFDGLKFYHYSEGSNWDNKPKEYHIQRSNILNKLLNRTIKNGEIKNLVLITSVCQTGNNSYTYTQIRSIFTPEERYKQLLETIKSARRRIPDCFIYLVEYSNFSYEEVLELNYLCDDFHNLYDNNLDNEIYSRYKALGERVMTCKALERILKTYTFKNMFKISGRYIYSEKFDYELYNNNKMNFYPIFNDKNNINTCGYKIPSTYIYKFLDYLHNNEENIITKFEGSYEQYIASFVKENQDLVSFLTSLGIEGKVSVCGTNFDT